MSVTPEELAEEHPDLLFCDGFDEALIGVVHRFGAEAVALYDRGKIIEIIMRDSLSWEEAEEHFSFNIIGAWMGDHTPAFADLATDRYRDPVFRRETLNKIDPCEDTTQ